MLPNDPQNQPITQSNLPPVAPGQLQQMPSPVTSVSPGAPAAGDQAMDRYVALAKQLVVQYGSDPYRLGDELGRLKSAYLAEQHHILPNDSGN
jgi:hypothetical protein